MDQEFIVTSVDILSGETKTLFRGEDQEIAFASFQAACMDVNSTAPTPILLEAKTVDDVKKIHLRLINAVVLFPGTHNTAWLSNNKIVEPEYAEVFEKLKNLYNVIKGYTEYGETVLNDEELIPAEE